MAELRGSLYGVRHVFYQGWLKREIVEDLSRLESTEEKTKVIMPQLRATVRTFYDVKQQLRGYTYIEDYQTMLEDVEPLIEELPNDKTINELQVLAKERIDAYTYSFRTAMKVVQSDDVADLERPASHWIIGLIGKSVEPSNGGVEAEEA